MSLRLRIALAAAIAVTVAVAAGSLVTFLLVREEIDGGVDRSLRDRAARISAALQADPAIDPLLVLPRPPGAPLGSASVFARIVDTTGNTVAALGEENAFPRNRIAVEVARSGPARYTTVEIGDIPVRVLAVPLGGGRALELARPLDEADAELGRITDILVGASVGGIVLGGLLGLLIAGRALLPVRRLAEVVDHVTRTRDLDRRAVVRGRDELSHLGAGFNAMLAALDDALAAQRRLVAEASHELRTPVTSLRADIGLLRRGDALDPADRDEIVAGLDDRLAEMSDLLRELMELAEGDLEPPSFEPVRLDLLVEEAAERLERRRAGVVVELALQPVAVEGAPSLLERAVSNLLDNAAKWNPSGAPIEVALLADGTLFVRDHGPGVPEEEASRIFERFYRGDRSDGVPGFGLGLAIVRRVAEAHGGAVDVDAAPDGGARFRLRIPALGLEPAGAAT